MWEYMFSFFFSVLSSYFQKYPTSLLFCPAFSIEIWLNSDTKVLVLQLFWFYVLIVGKFSIRNILPLFCSNIQTSLSTWFVTSMALCFSAIGCDAAVQELSKAVVSYLADLAFSLVLHISPPLFPFSFFVFSMFAVSIFPRAGAAMSALSWWRPYRFCLNSRFPSFLPLTPAGPENPQSISVKKCKAYNWIR